MRLLPVAASGFGKDQFAKDFRSAQVRDLTVMHRMRQLHVGPDFEFQPQPAPGLQITDTEAPTLTSGRLTVRMRKKEPPPAYCDSFPRALRQAVTQTVLMNFRCQTA